MTAPLEDRVGAYVADHPGCSFEDIRRAVRAQSKTIREVLADPMFVSRSAALRGRTSQRSYYLGSLPENDLDGFRAARSQPSQAQRMADLLADGQWHSDAELWDIGVGRPNSRAAELRKRGFMVEHRREASEVLPSRAHQYRITSRPVEAATGSFDSLPSPGLVAASSGRGRADGEPPVAAAAPEPSGQLTLVGGAFTRSAAA